MIFLWLACGGDLGPDGSTVAAEALEAQQIENAADLQLTLPNVSFTKSNFTASSFTITKTTPSKSPTSPKAPPTALCWPR